MGDPVVMSNDQLLALIEGMRNIITVPRSPPNNAGNINFTNCKSRFAGNKDEDVDAFINAITIYKDCIGLSNDDALRGLPMLLDNLAATWFQGAKSLLNTWQTAIDGLKHAFGRHIPPYKIFKELFAKEQVDTERTDIFVSSARALLAQLPTEPVLHEIHKLDMVYGLLHRKIRNRLPRNQVQNFEDLIEKARSIEANFAETALSKDVRPSVNKIRPKCKFCKCFGHTEAECRKYSRFQSGNSQIAQSEPARRSDVVCYGCGSPGVYRSKCVKCNPSAKSDKSNNSDLQLNFTTVSRTDPGSPQRPMLSIQVCGLNGTALADSGAQACVASKSLYDVLLKKGVTFVQDNIQLSYADSVNRTKQALKTNVNVLLMGRSIPTTFYVLPESQGNITLLGVDFLEQAGIVLCIPQRVWYFFDTPDQFYPYHENVKNVTTNLAKVSIDQLRNDEGSQLTSKERSQLNALLTLHSDVFAKNGEVTSHTEHCIDTGNQQEAVLLQGEGNEEIPVEYASRSLLLAERNNLTTEEDDHRSWPSKLSAVRFAMNTTKSESTGCSAAYLTYGRELRTPNEVHNDLKAIVESENYVPQITPYLQKLALTLRDAREQIEYSQDRRKEVADSHRRLSPVYETGDLVLLKTHQLSNAAKGFTSKFVPKRDGPYVVEKRVSPTAYEIATKDEQTVVGTYHVSDLTPFKTSNTTKEVPAPLNQVRRRGRPRKEAFIMDPGPSPKPRGRPP